MSQRRLPWEPIQERLDLLRADYQRDPGDAGAESYWPTTILRLADACGISRRGLQRYATEGVVVNRADDIACALGVHVLSLWPDLRLKALTAPDRRCRARGCRTIFVQLHGGPEKLYCGRPCKAREHMRRLYHQRVDAERARARDRRAAARAA